MHLTANTKPTLETVTRVPANSVSYDVHVYTDCEIQVPPAAPPIRSVPQV